MDMYTPLYLKWITNKDRKLRSISCGSLGVGGDLGENGYIYIWLSPFPVHLKLSHNIVNQLYSNIKKFFFKHTNTVLRVKLWPITSCGTSDLPASLELIFFSIKNCLKGPF